MTPKDLKKGVFFRILLVMLLVFLAVYFFSVIADYSPFYDRATDKNALVEINKDVTKIETLIEERFSDLNEVKKALTDMSSHKAISDTIATFVGTEHFGDLRFFSNGKVYSANGLEVTNEVDLIKAFMGLNRRSFSGDYIDTYMSKSCVAFYIPVAGSDNISGLVSIVEARNFINLETALNEKSQAVALITDAGVNLCDKVKGDTEIVIGNNYYNFIERFTQNADYGKEVSKLVAGNKSGVAHFKSLEEKYVVAVKPIDLVENKLFLVTLSLSENLMAEEMQYLRHIITL